MAESIYPPTYPGEVLTLTGVPTTVAALTAVDVATADVPDYSPAALIARLTSGDRGDS